MFKVGKHEFIVRAPQQVFDRNYYEWVDRGDAEPEYSYFTTVSDIRVEEIHPCKNSCILIIFLVYGSRKIGQSSPEREKV
jgi:hypothetical protein